MLSRTGNVRRKRRQATWGLCTAMPHQIERPSVCPSPGARQLVLFGEGIGRKGAAILRNISDIRVALSEEQGAGPAMRLAPGEGMLFERLGVALVQGDADQTLALRGQTGAHDLIVEPERSVRAAGLRAAFDTEGAGRSRPMTRLGTSWGLRATGVLGSRYGGRGVRVAILDTGLDFGHPDFAKRAIASRAFVAGRSVSDRNGHGTCCAGIACGPKRSRCGSRYGIAFGAELYIAKVLDDEATGTDGSVLAGIDWAIRNGCSVISISLGTPVGERDRYSRIYERIASRALAAGSLLIAPVGNSSQRPERVAPVEHPANCPSVLSVGAVNQNLRLATFSNGALDPPARGVDLVAPGTAVLSSAPRPALHQIGSGTSIAAAFVAGIAALLAEASPGARGAALRELLLKSTRPSADRARAAAVGVVHAP